MTWKKIIPWAVAGLSVFAFLKGCDNDNNVAGYINSHEPVIVTQADSLLHRVSDALGEHNFALYSLNKLLDDPERFDSTAEVVTKELKKYSDVTKSQAYIEAKEKFDDFEDRAKSEKGTPLYVYALAIVGLVGAGVINELTN